MNIFLIIAGLLCFLLGIVHSILGEYLIFNSKRKKGHLVPSMVNSELKERHLRILWATWHLVSVFGFCFGIILIYIALLRSEVNTGIIHLLIKSIASAMFMSALLVLVGTKGKHPGWIILLVITILIIIGNGQTI